MKKLLALCVVGALAVSLVGCTSSPPSNTGTSTGKVAVPTDKGGGTPIKSDKGTSDKGPGGTDVGKETTVEGTVKEATAEKITLTDKDKKEHTVMTEGAKLTRDNKEAKGGELKAGDTVKVTMKDGKATTIAATAGTPAPAADATEGTVTKVEGDKITFKDKDGKEHTVTVEKDAKVTVDAAGDKKLTDVKEGNKIKLTNKDGKVTAVDVTTK